MAKLAALVLVFLIFWLQYHVWFGKSSLGKISQLHSNIADQKTHNRQLKNQNQRLKKEINLVRNEPKILEEKARENLGLIKENEIFYRIIPTSGRTGINYPIDD